MPVQTLHDNAQMHITQSPNRILLARFTQFFPQRLGETTVREQVINWLCEGPSRPQNIPSMKCPPMRLHDFRQGQKRQRQNPLHFPSSTIQRQHHP